MTLTVKLLIGVLIATILGVAAFSFIGNGFQGPMIVATSSGSTVTDMLKVEISGEVNNPGIYYVEVDSNLDALIESANGITKNADTLCFNYDLIVEDNASYYIAPLYDLSDVCGNDKLVKYNINTCLAVDLQNIDGIGKSISESIVNYRNEIGEYQQLEDIMKVSGIGNSTFSKLRNHIRLKD